jgi:hypothetical protein
VDAKSLIEMINSLSLPNAPMTRWVTFIQFFSFTMKHVPGKTFTMPDGLSRRPPDPGEVGEDFDEEEKWIKPHPGFGLKQTNMVHLEIQPSKSSQIGIWKDLQYYLETLNRPPDCSSKDWANIKHKSAMFFMSEGQLKRRNEPFPQVVVTNPELQKSVLKELHEELGHRGMDETYRRTKLRF